MDRGIKRNRGPSENMLLSLVEIEKQLNDVNAQPKTSRGPVNSLSQELSDPGTSLLGEIQKELKLLEKHTNIYHLKSNSGK
jgi:hypothetical protein